MRNIMRRLLSVLLSLVILVAAVPAAHAENEETYSGAVKRISSVEGLLQFAELCRLDTYSRNQKVILDADLDLTGTEFPGIPTFGGIFEGNGHTIRGLEITGDGSAQGFFRYLQQTAVVRNLRLEGSVTPGGSRSAVGGIAGSNAGTITNCTFSGTVTGTKQVGGIVGRNEVTGIVEEVAVYGTVHGDHFVGGIAGENSGVIRASVSRAAVNTEASQNSVEISDITLDTLTGSESATTVTDIGGVAGTSTGVIRACENYGSVGYPRMGYNIGGIAGSQMGYIVGCVNYADVSGRKEVGGIVGQMEPTTFLEYQEDALQILQQQLNEMSDLANQASANVQGSTANLQGQIGALQGQVGSAMDAVDQILPDVKLPEDGEPGESLPEIELPDQDSLQAAQNTLSSSITAMSGTLGSIASAGESILGSVNSSLDALTEKMNAMGETLNSASEHVGGSATDISDADTEETVSGKVAECINYGFVLGDLNTGGVVGAISVENDLDPESDLEIGGNQSLNFAYELRAVVLRCENHGEVSVKRQHAGGIAGRAILGLIRDCRNTGSVEAGDYIGGIVGRSDGFVRACSVKCILTGSAYAGGIAGFGATVTDCLSMVLIRSEGERQGAVLGWTDLLPGGTEETKVLNNRYLPVGDDIGGIDGISYAGSAAPMRSAAFFAQTELPELFHTVTVRFQLEDGTVEERILDLGSILIRDEIPEVPEKEGYTGEWLIPDTLDLDAVVFDTTIRAVYTPLETTIRSSEIRENGMPVLLAQGAFGETQSILLERGGQTPDVNEGETVLEVWDYSVAEGGAAEQLRFALPEGVEGSQVRLLLHGAGGWREISFRENKSYLVFPVEAADDAFCLVGLAESNAWMLWAIICGAAVIVLAVTLLLVRRRRRKKAAAAKKTQNAENQETPEKPDENS